MKKYFAKAAALCLALCLILIQGSAAFADDLMHNSLIENAYVFDPGSFTEYYVGYYMGSNDSGDWGLALQEETSENATVGRMYTGSAKVGNTLSAEVNCMTSGVRLGVMFEAHDADQNVLGTAEASNEQSGADTVSCELTVPEGTVDVAMLLVEFPESGGYGAPGTIAVMAEFLIDGKAESPVSPMEAPDEPASSEEPGPEPVSADDVDGGQEKEESSGSVIKTVAIVGAGVVAAAGAGIAIAKGIGAKGAAKAAAGFSAAEVPKEETYTLKDAATGAETLYIKDTATGEWVSSDGSSVLDPDRVSEWQNQRNADRAWQDEANKGVEKPTRFEDIDAEEARMNEQISKETYYEKIAIKHGADPSDMDSVYEKVAHDQAMDEVRAQQWTEAAERADTGLKIAENLKTTADYSVSALGAVTGPAGTVVKDIYAAGTTIGGDVSQAVADGKDAYEIAQTAAGAVTKTAVAVIQNHATGAGGKAAADIAGGATTGGIDAYVQGKDVGQGIATGTASGILSAGVDAGGEMAGALKDTGMADGLKKELASEAIDAGGDFIKSSMDDAVSESFDKTFEDLKPKK